MQYTAIAKDGGLFIPNLSQFVPNEIITLNIQSFERNPFGQDDDDDENFDDLIGILEGVDGVEFQNALRDENDDELKLPFEVLPARGTMATNKLINKIREEEGI